MAKRSKTQKAKASAARAAKKAERERESVEALEGDAPEAASATEAADEGAKKRGLLKKDSAESDKPDKPKAASKGTDMKKAEKPKKKHFQFLREVRGELKRVTWPTKKDVGQWTAVVVAALIFFGAYVAILDNLVITPALVGVSSIEAPAVDAPEVEGSGGGGNVGLNVADGSQGEGSDEGASADDAQQGAAEGQAEGEASSQDSSASAQEG